MKKQVIFLSLFSFVLFSCTKKDSSFQSSYIGADYVPTAGGEAYQDYQENSFISTADEDVSTFSVDADGGSYSNCRDLIKQGTKPPSSAVRIEEFINYFNYNYQDETDAIALNGEICVCPWKPEHHLLRIGIKGKNIDPLPAINFVLLLDVSGSMQSEEKLPLLKKSLMYLVNRMNNQDRLAIVTYAGSSEVVLESTSNKAKIAEAIANLQSGGGTNGEGGIKKAYEIAEQNFMSGANNRIIVASDGDFNIGVSSAEELETLVESKKDKGIYLTTIGLGRGNYNDSNMESIANHGNGTYEYIDSEEQGKRLFNSEFNRLFTIAEDVKVQIDFNENTVKSYRLIGYENRVLASDDFDNDKKDAGEIGVNQDVTALYEIEFYSGQNDGHEALLIDFRYKETGATNSLKKQLFVYKSSQSFENSSASMQFSAALAAFGMEIKNSIHKGNCTLDKVLQWTYNAHQKNPNSEWLQHLQLVQKYASLN